MVQPNAQTPPKPMSAPPSRCAAKSSRDAKPSRRKFPVVIAYRNEPTTTPNTAATPNPMVEPVYVMRYCKLSATGATNENDCNGVGSNSSAPITPVTYHPTTIKSPTQTPANT